MVHFSNVVSPNGPLLTVLVGVSTQRHARLIASGQPAPPMQSALMLVDTGATNTNLCSSILSHFNLSPTGEVAVLTPSTGSIPHKACTYDVSFGIIGRTSADTHFLPAVRVVASDFTAQGIHGLIGRDILSRARLTYSGPDQFFYLSF